MRRIAIFSDIHANLRALDAVLSDIEAAGITECFCLGDLVGYGPDPRGVIERIRETRIPTVAGNYDEGVGTRRGDCGCYYKTPEAREDGDASYRFTDRALEDSDREWLVALPGQIAFDVSGAHVLLAHGSPRKINEYLLPDRTPEQLVRLATRAGADVVCHGHIHIPYHRSFTAADGASRIHYVSSGSVGKPKDGDPRANWVELIFAPESTVRDAIPADRAAAPVGETDMWLGALFHRVAYDIDATVQAMRAAGLPDRLMTSLHTGT